MQVDLPVKGSCMRRRSSGSERKVIPRANDGNVFCGEFIPRLLTGYSQCAEPNPRCNAGIQNGFKTKSDPEDYHEKHEDCHSADITRPSAP
jgi:hypothetical protein